MASVAVVGAGIAGLLAARALAGRHDVVVVERERQVGGRLATRASAAGAADEGAQFFTARSPEFAAVVDELVADGVVEVWHRDMLEIGGERRTDGHPRYRGTRGMAPIADRLAAGLDVRTGVRVERLERRRGAWHVVLHDQETLGADAVLVTTPAPVAVALVASAELADEVLVRLAAIAYDRCLAVVAELDGPSGLAEPGALRLGPEPIEWVADNQRKGIAAAPVLTVHVGPAASAAWWEDADAAIADRVEAAIAGHVGARFGSSHVRRWPHSRPRSPRAERFLAVDAPVPLVFAGDAHGGPLVEGAAQSGLAAAAHLAGLLR